MKAETSQGEAPPTQEWARLSGRHLAALQHSPWQDTGPLLINERLDASVLAASVLLVNARRVLANLWVGGGAPVLADGRFAASAEATLIDHLWWGPTGVREPAPGVDPNSAFEPRPLTYLRLALLSIGAITIQGGRATVSPMGAELVHSQHGGRLYGKLLRTYFRDLDHPAIDGEAPTPAALSFVPCSLWIVGQLPPTWTDTSTVIRLLVPDKVLRRDERGYRTSAAKMLSPPSTADLFRARVLDPLLDFALLERQLIDDPPRPGPRGWRRGPVYDRVISFDFTDAE